MTARFALAAPLLIALLALPAPATAQDDSVNITDLGDLTPQQQLEAIGQQAKEQFEAGEYDAAVQSFTTIINAYERVGAYAPGPLLFRAKCYANLEEYVPALEDLKNALQYAQQQPAVIPEIHNTRAEIYLELNAFQEALPDVQEATKLNRVNPLYQFNLGKVLVNLGGVQEGEQALTKYLEAEIEEEDPAIRAEALRLRGQAFGGLRDFDKARADISESLQIEPDSHEAYFTRAQIALAEEDYTAAAADLEQSIAKYVPDDEEDDLPFMQGMLTRASVLEEQGKQAAGEGDHATAAQAYEGCRQQCEAILEAVPEDDLRAPQIRLAALFRRAIAERLLGQFGDAVKTFSLALEIDPGLGDAYFRRGICFHYQGEEDLAVRDFEQAASINFDSPRANLWKGMSHAAAGDYAEAIRAYGESIAVSDRYTPAYVNRALAHLAESDFDKAISDFNEAIRLQPTEATHYFRRGKALSLAGDREKAIQSYMKAIDFDGAMAPAYAAVAEELEANGQGALAAEYRQRASALGR